MFKKFTHRAVSLILTIVMMLPGAVVAPLTASAGGTSGFDIWFTFMPPDYSEDAGWNPADFSGKFGFENEKGDKFFIDLKDTKIVEGGLIKWRIDDKNIKKFIPADGNYKVISYPPLPSGYEYVSHKDKDRINSYLNQEFKINLEEGFGVDFISFEVKRSDGPKGKVTSAKSAAASDKAAPAIKITIAKGDILHLGTNLSSAATWTSSSAKTAAVDKNGTVTAKSKGLTYISAKIGAGTTLKIAVSVK